MLKKSISMGVFALATATLSMAANQSTFEDLQSTTSAVKTHADAINAIYKTTGYDWNTEHLQAIRDQTNRAGQDLRRLQERALTPTEQRAVNLATPLLRAIATDASEAIRVVGEQGRPVINNGALLNERFHERIVAVEANATKANRIFENLRNYENTRGQLESLQKGLEGDQVSQPAEAGR
jgi:hypothetical protein